MDEVNHRRTGWRPTALAALLVCAAFLAPTSSASALTLGVGWTGESGQIEPEMPLVAKSGAQAFRVPLPPTNDNAGVVRKASESGVALHAEVSAEYPGDPGLPSNANGAENRTDFLNKLSAEVRRFGYNGSFWGEKGNEGLPKDYITTWEIWNEPNLHGIEAGEFGQFVSEAANTIQTASQAQGGRGTSVLSGGLLVWGNKGTGSIGYYGAMEYLATAYSKFGTNSNVTGVAIHPYELDDSTFLNGSKTTRVEAFKYAVAGYHTKLVELAKGGAQKSLWITETGWPAEGPQYSIGEAEQANSLRQVIDYLRNNEAFLNVKDVLWYNFRDAPGASSWDDFCGLRAHDGHFRQAWTAFQEKAGVKQFVPQAPTAETQAASQGSESSVTLNGSVNPHGLPTAYHFEYGTTESYGSSAPVPDGNAGEGEGAGAINAVVRNLQPGVRYFYRLVATNALGTTLGNGQSIFVPRPTFYLSNSNSAPAPSITTPFTKPNDVILRGDWTGQGKDTIGLYRPSTREFILSNSNTSPTASIDVTWGEPGDVPLVGDWTGQGKDTIGLYRSSTRQFILSNSNTAPAANITTTWGESGDTPLVGDWTGQGKDTIGLFRASAQAFFLSNSNTAPAANITATFGSSGDVPIVGDWTGQRKNTIGLFRTNGP